VPDGDFLLNRFFDFCEDWTMKNMIRLACLTAVASGAWFVTETMAMANKTPSECVFPEIVAHRGFSHVAPENTLAAINLAWQIDCSAVECDVQLTRDNRIVLMHDESAKRTTGRDWKIAETDSDQLRSLDAGSWKAPQYAGEKIPFLEDVLKTIPPHRTLFIEIKCKSEILPYLKELISKSGKSDRLALICFDLDVVSAAKAIMPSIPAYWLVGTEKDEQTGKPIPHSPDLVRIAMERKLDGLDVNFAGITNEFAEQVLTSGLKLYTWTVDDEQEAKRLRDLKVHGITTNRPDYLREKLPGQNKN
jgi:glycerophosphoryl diester phosphodiesterase